MRTSIIIAAYNEGHLLARTVRSCVETCRELDHEIIIADDSSSDRSVRDVQERFPQVRIVRHPRDDSEQPESLDNGGRGLGPLGLIDDRRGISECGQRFGPSPTKDLGARHARGEVLVFLDGHCKPEPHAIRRLVQDVEQLRGRAIVTPTVTGLDVDHWKCSCSQRGHGYFLDLRTFDCGWLPLSKLRSVKEGARTFYESPAAIGCAVAMGRELYERLWGFDPRMRCWGLEDLDLSLKCWLLGFRILHDPEPVVAHRFRKQFDNYDVPPAPFIVNQLRMARKNFTHGVWNEWVARCCRRHNSSLRDHPEGLWARVWTLFESGRQSVEEERSALNAMRTRDEFWYAERFALNWPKLGEAAVAEPLAVTPLATEISAKTFAFYPSPSPGCNECKILRNGAEITDANRNVLPGEEIALSLDCPEGTVTDIQWIINEKAFKNYIANNNQGVLILIDQAERHAPSVTFYWANTGDGRVVECRFKLDGEWCTASATLNVKTPIVTFNTGYNPPPMGTIQLNAANDRVGLYPEPGIVFDAKVEVPTGFANGSWQYVQLVLPNTTVKISATGICKSRRSNDLVLDTQYPYDGPWATGAMFQNTDDSPGGPLPANFSQRNGNHQILMYIMFRPSGANSQWVPVRKVLWKVNWCCTNNSGTWSLDESGQSTGSWLTTSDHPQWKANVINLPTIEVPCPPPCNP